MSKPTRKHPITVSRGIVEAAGARSGPSGPSADVAAAVARRIERDNLDELVQAAEAEHGPITEEEIRALRDRLRRARRQQTGDEASEA